MSFTQLVSLDMMENTVRRMTGRYTTQQMTSQQIYNYINLFYTLHFPQEFKTLKLTKPYVLLTTPNVDTYDFPYESGLVDDPTQPAGNKNVPGNIQITPPVYCQGYLLRYYQDKSTFYNRWPKLTVNQIVNSGDGTAGPYSGTITSFPFLRAQLDIFGVVTEAAVIISVMVNDPNSANSAFTYTTTDVPQANSNVGNLVDEQGNVVGTVNYLTGSYTFTSVTGVLPADSTIYASAIPYMPSRPTDVIFYNNQITFRPVPFQVYQVEFQISQQPTQLIANNSAPELDEWYLFICAGAARLIYTDFPDPEGMAYIDQIFQEQMLIAQRRTLKQLGTQRAQTIFSTPGWGRNAAQYFTGSAYSGN